MHSWNLCPVLPPLHAAHDQQLVFLFFLLSNHLVTQRLYLYPTHHPPKKNKNCLNFALLRTSWDSKPAVGPQNLFCIQASIMLLPHRSLNGNYLLKAISSFCSIENSQQPSLVGAMHSPPAMLKPMSKLIWKTLWSLTTSSQNDGACKIPEKEEIAKSTHLPCHRLGKKAPSSSVTAHRVALPVRHIHI